MCEQNLFSEIFFKNITNPNDTWKEIAYLQFVQVRSSLLLYSQIFLQMQFIQSRGRNSWLNFIFGRGVRSPPLGALPGLALRAPLARRRRGCPVVFVRLLDWPLCQFVSFFVVRVQMLVFVSGLPFSATALAGTTTFDLKYK